MLKIDLKNMILIIKNDELPEELILKAKRFMNQIKVLIELLNAAIDQLFG